MIKKLFAWVRYILLFLWVVLMILIGGYTLSQNRESVDLQLFGWSHSDALGTFLTLSLSLGIVIACLVLVPVILLEKAKTRRLRKKLKKLESDPNGSAVKTVEG